MESNKLLDIEEIIKYINNYDEIKDKYEELIMKNYNKEDLDYIFYLYFKYDNNENEIDNIKIEDKIKRQDSEFKNKVINNYKTCIITGRSKSVCEVAHILPFSESNNEQKYDEYNGILLCRDLHCLFDKKLISIDYKDFKLILSKDILEDNTLEIYHEYNNKILNIKEETRKYLELINKFN